MNCLLYSYVFRFESNLRYTDQLPVRLISDQVLSHVEFRSSPDPTKKNLLCKLAFRLSSLKVDRTVSPTNRDMRKSRVCYYDNSYSTALFAAVDRRLEQPRSQCPLLLSRSPERCVDPGNEDEIRTYPWASKNSVQKYLFIIAFTTLTILELK